MNGIEDLFHGIVLVSVQGPHHFDLLLVQPVEPSALPQGSNSCVPDEAPAEFVVSDTLPRWSPCM